MRGPQSDVNSYGACGQTAIPHSGRDGEGPPERASAVRSGFGRPTYGLVVVVVVVLTSSTDT